MYSNSIDFYYHNVNGINSKINSCFLNISGCDYDVICFTETKLRESANGDNISNTSIAPDTYDVFRCDRNAFNSCKNGAGGGVLVAVKLNL